MRVLVAGAGGFLGLGVTRALVAGGHEVVGLVRREQSVRAVAVAGGRPVIADVVRDREVVSEASVGADALVHMASDPKDELWSRVLACSRLLKVVEHHKIRRFVVGSGVWLYGNHRDVITETTPPEKDGGISPFNLQTEETALLHATIRGTPEVVIVRPGMVYGKGSWFATVVGAIRTGTYRYAGRGANRWPTVHIDDTGRALVVALERGQAGEAYLVADEAPPTVREFTRHIADLLGAPRPKGAPLFRLARTVEGRTARAHAMNQVVSNAKLRSLGWRPRFPTYRDGVPAVLREMGLIAGG